MTPSISPIASCSTVSSDRAVAATHAVDLRLQDAEAVLFQRTPEVAGQRISGKMQQQPGRRIERGDDVHHQLLRRAGARHHHLETQRTRFLGGCLADCEQRQSARLGQRRVRLQRAQSVAAGGDQRLHAVEVDGIGILERHLQQRLDGGLMPVLFQRRL